MFAVENLGFRIEGKRCTGYRLGCRDTGVWSRVRVYSLRCRVHGSRFRVQGSGFRVMGYGFRVQGSGFRVQG